LWRNHGRNTAAVELPDACRPRCRKREWTRHEGNTSSVRVLWQYSYCIFLCRIQKPHSADACNQKKLDACICGILVVMLGWRQSSVCTHNTFILIHGFRSKRKRIHKILLIVFC
jgi:hypothetical protein